jgi:hypothetical protein
MRNRTIGQLKKRKLEQLGTEIFTKTQPYRATQAYEEIFIAGKTDSQTPKKRAQAR